RGLPKKSGGFEAILRIGLAQLLYLPDLKAHSAVFLAVESARRDPRAKHLSGLMNAVLRRAQAEAEDLRAAPPEPLIPDFFRARWHARYGAEAVADFAAALVAGAGLDLTFKDAADMAGLGAVPVLADTGRLVLRDKPVEQLAGF